MTQESKPFREMNEKEQEEFLAERQAVSARKYNEIKEINKIAQIKRKEQKQRVHEGNKFIYQSEQEGKPVRLSKFGLRQFIFTTGIVELERDKANQWVLCRAAYAIKSPTDEMQDRIGMGLVGYRIKNPCEYTLTLRVPIYIWELEEKALNHTIHSMIVPRITLAAEEVPWRVINEMFGDRIKQWSRIERGLEEMPVEEEVPQPVGNLGSEHH